MVVSSGVLNSYVRLKTRGPMSRPEFFALTRSLRTAATKGTTSSGTISCGLRGLWWRSGAIRPEGGWLDQGYLAQKRNK